MPVDSVSTGGCGESGQSGKELQLTARELPPSRTHLCLNPTPLIAGMTLPVAVAQPQETPAGEYGPAITPAQSGDALPRLSRPGPLLRDRRYPCRRAPTHRRGSAQCPWRAR